MSAVAQRKQCPRTLVVDDLADAAHTFAALLKSLGCETTAITDPFAAVETVERIQPEAVFLDLNMPGLTGLDLARILRKKYGWQRLRIVAVTAFGSEEHRTATREAGFDAHVVKPVDPRLLESMIHTLFPEMRWMTNLIPK
jgi:CheY-like chemotaxis protein